MTDEERLTDILMRRPSDQGFEAPDVYWLIAKVRELSEMLNDIKLLNRYIVEARIEVREACAKIAEEMYASVSPLGPLHAAGFSDAAKHIATAIRAQGGTQDA